MRLFPFAVIVAVSLWLVAGSAHAETVIEAYRSFGPFRDLSMNTSDGTLWVISAASVLHLDSDGHVLGRYSGFSLPSALAVNPTDGSLWVSDQLQGAVLHLAADGTLLSRTPDLSSVDLLSVNPVNGSCLAAVLLGYVVVCLGEDGTEQWRSTNEQVYDLAASSLDDTWWLAPWPSDELMHCVGSNGSYGIEGWPYSPPPCSALAVDPEDGSCWAIADGLVHVSADNIVLSTNEIVLPEGAGIGGVLDMAVDSADPGCWLGFDGCVARVATNGRATAIFPNAGPYPTDEHHFRVAADPTDSSCWALGRTDGEFRTNLRHVSKEGTLRYDVTTGLFPSTVSVNTSDGSCWVSYRSWDTGPGAVHLAPNGHFLTYLPNFGSAAVAANPTDGSLWGNNGYVGVVHVSRGGTQLAAVATQTGVVSVSVNPTDGSCWAAASGYPGYGALPASQGLQRPPQPPSPGDILHLSATGDVLLHWTPDLAYAVSVNLTDGSCWVAASGGLTHVSANGDVLWHGLGGGSVSVNPTDGSCWVGSYGMVALLAADGTLLFQRSDLSGACTVAAVPGDGSCWVAVSPEYPDQGPSYVLHLAANGQELSRTLGFYHPLSVSVDPFNGSCWVADTQNSQVVHLVVEGVSDTTFRDVPRSCWAFDEIEACYSAGIVGGYWDGYHPEDTLNRGQMAVYVSRALAGGDAGIPDGPAHASFRDVPTDYWAYKWIEYAYAHNIVGGYWWDGYWPARIVDRGQMAVFVARAMVDPTGDAGLAGYTPPATPTFPDVPADYWSYRWIEYLYEQGIVGGYWDGYHPTETVNRAQIAVYVQRAFELPM